MNQKNKLEQKTPHIHHTYKTKDAFVNDFMRWLKEKQALKKQKAEKPDCQNQPQQRTGVDGMG